MSLKYPLLVIDIEASGLEPDCYPIELGIARRQNPKADIELLETLIKPTDIWSNNHPWDVNAQKIHGIWKHELDKAPDVFCVMESVIKWLGKDVTLISDNPFYDQRWMLLLSQATQSKFMPQIIWPSHLDRIKFHQHNSNVAHRAGKDAISILHRLETASTKELAI